MKPSTTLRSSLWCSHCSVAKRQQFSCSLGTATLSLKLENVVPGCWICFFSYCGQVFFYCSSIGEQYSYVRVFKQKSHNVRVTFFSSSTAEKHGVLLSASFFFEARLKPIAASATLIEKSTTLEYLPCIHTSTRWILRDSIQVYHHDFCRENCLIWPRECWSSQSGGARIRLHGSGSSDFSNSSKTRANQLHLRLYRYLVEFVRAWCVFWRLQWGARRQRKSEEVLNDLGGNLRGRFWPNPGFKKHGRTIICVNIWRTTQLAKLSFNHSHGRTHSWRFSTFYKIIFDGIARTAFFVLWAMQHRWNRGKKFWGGYTIPHPLFLHPIKAIHVYSAPGFQPHTSRWHTASQRHRAAGLASDSSKQERHMEAVYSIDGCHLKPSGDDGPDVENLNAEISEAAALSSVPTQSFLYHSNSSSSSSSIKTTAQGCRHHIPRVS